MTEKSLLNHYIKNVLRPFLDVFQIRDNLVFIEGLHLQFCVAAGSNRFR